MHHYKHKKINNRFKNKQNIYYLKLSHLILNQNGYYIDCMTLSIKYFIN